MTTVLQQQEEEAIRHWLTKIGLPESVRNTGVYLDNDSEGEPAVFLYFALADDLSESVFHDTALKIRTFVWEHYAGSGLQRNIYLRFRTASEGIAWENEFDSDEDTV